MPQTRLSPIRVLLISRRALIRTGLSALLRGQPQIQVVGELAAPSEMLGADVLVWDAGGEQPRALPARFIALLADLTDARAWLAAGATGIVLETSPIEGLLDAIRQVARGESFLPRDYARQVFSSIPIPESSPEPPTDPLTPREREVLRLLAQGLSNKDIAQKLYLSVRTVEGHLANIYGKLQVKSRTEAAVRASRNL
ncbi:MAG: response regulator transcription factor [Chloroflexi bacterium]|nr:response regulator transcription factor [Chloroflexota bacterium]